MGGVIFFNTLNRKLKKALKTRQLSVEELDKVYQDMKNEVEKERKDKLSTIIAIAFSAFVCVGIIKMSIDERTAFVEIIPDILIMVVFCVVMIFLMKWLEYGLMTQQFHAAVKKGYPELADKYRL